MRLGLSNSDNDRQVRMDKLRELTSSIDFNAPYDGERQRKIYDLVQSLPSPDASSTLPPWLVFYAARNILSPSFIIGQIPDLLDLLATVETLRRYATLKCDEALEWQKYYEREKGCGREQDVRLLAADEIRALRHFLLKNDVQRREYIMLVRCLIQLYIHYLWTAPEMCLLPRRLNDFFPGSLGVDTPSEMLFHVDLSEEEKEYFGQLKAECKEWMDLVSAWETKREESCREEGTSQKDMDDTFGDDFRATFPQPCKPSEVVRNVEIYMNKAEDIVRKLEQWFPPSGI